MKRLIFLTLISIFLVFSFFTEGFSAEQWYFIIREHAGGSKTLGPFDNKSQCTSQRLQADCFWGNCGECYSVGKPENPWVYKGKVKIEEKGTIEEWINPELSIPVGGKLYSISKGGISAIYYYQALTDKAIVLNKIVLKEGEAVGKLEIQIPLTAHKQAMFIPNLTTEIQGGELLITVVDDFGRLKIEKAKKAI